MRYAATHESFISLNEADLVSVAQKGDLEAFNRLVLSYQDKIFTLAVRILGDEDSAKDITQNTFVSAYLKLHRFRNGSFRSWLYRIATNACYDEFRRHKRHPILSFEDEDDAEERLSPPYDFSGPSILPEKEFERRELEHVVHQASTSWIRTNELWLCWSIYRTSTTRKLRKSLAYPLER